MTVQMFIYCCIALLHISLSFTQPHISLQPSFQKNYGKIESKFSNTNSLSSSATKNSDIDNNILSEQDPSLSYTFLENLQSLLPPGLLSLFAKKEKENVNELKEMLYELVAKCQPNGLKATGAQNIEVRSYS